MWECLAFLCFFDFSPRTARQGAARCVKEGEKLREIGLQEKPKVSGGNAVCLECGPLEIPDHFSDSLRMG